jgi:poly(3-hydroxybutyrate) depolymerase
MLRALGAIALALGGRDAPLPAQSAPAPTEQPRTLQVGGESRGYLLYVPPGYRRDRPAPPA